MICKKNIIYLTTVIATVVLSVILLDAYSGGGLFKSNIYNSYVLQAQRWLAGKLDLGSDYSYLELAYYNDKVFVSFPPFPSVVILPFVMICGINTPDHIIALICCALSAYYAYKLCKSLGLTDKSAAFLSLFSCIGSNFLFIMVNGGWVWYFAQILSFLFTVMSFYYANCSAKTRVPYFLAPFFLACAVGCRPFQIVYTPITAFLLYNRLKKEGSDIKAYIKSLFIWAIPAAILCVFYLILNQLRFGSIFEFGHNYLPEFQEASLGQFHIDYLKQNIVNLFRLPYISESGLLTFYKFDGTAFWIISPLFVTFFVLSLIRIYKRSDKVSAFLHIAVPVLIAVHLLIICSHKTMGGWHFGNRYTIDALPAALLGVSNLWEKKNDESAGLLNAVNTPLLLAGFMINVIGTYWLYIR